MMLRGNLATRPFYNERIVTLVLALVAVVVAGLTVTNATRLIRLSSQRSELQAQIATDEAAALRIRQAAASVQNGVDQTALAALAGSTREANQLIDARTFSWTTFFSYIESAIPTGVLLTSVVPEFQKGDIIIRLGVVGKQVEDVTAFMNALEKTGAFYDVGPTAVEPTEEGFDRVTVRGLYVPPPPRASKPGDGGGQ
jgi:cell division protein FtsL